MKMIQLKICEINTGFCQITYKTKSDSNQWIYYCLQDNGRLHGGIRLMRTTDDYEPSHEIKFKKDIKAIFEKPSGNTELEKLCRDWIEKYEKENDIRNQT